METQWKTLRVTVYTIISSISNQLKIRYHNFTISAVKSRNVVIRAKVFNSKLSVCLAWSEGAPGCPQL